jgi:hypothetical protein
MTHFTPNTVSRPASKLAGVKPAPIRDVLWGRPIFKAPQLPVPRLAFEPLPFTATRVTQRGPQSA